MYTITLADGQMISNLSINGDNYVSETEIDESIFENNLSIMTVSDGETEITYENVELIQQVHYTDGYYICFRELTAQELETITINSKIDYLAMMSDIDLEV